MSRTHKSVRVYPDENRPQRDKSLRKNYGDPVKLTVTSVILGSGGAVATDDEGTEFFVSGGVVSRAKLTNGCTFEAYVAPTRKEGRRPMVVWAKLVHADPAEGRYARRLVEDALRDDVVLSLPEIVAEVRERSGADGFDPLDRAVIEAACSQLYEDGLLHRISKTRAGDPKPAVIWFVRAAQTDEVDVYPVEQDE